MVAMSGRCSLRTKCHHDIGAMAAEKGDDLADQSVRVEIAQHPIAMAGHLHSRYAQHLRGRRELVTTKSGKLGTRRNGDAGATPGIPVSRAIERAAHSVGDVSRD